MEKLKVLDLFSGIGGFSLGLERTGGFETVAFCEIEEFPRKVLKKHWPEVPCYEDVTKLTGEQVGPVDVICGGYPCQGESFAGKRGGKEDDRWLWPEFSRLVAELRPTWVVGENVFGHISMGLDDVLSDLEGQGYACRTFVIPACAVDAQHRRDRCWTVAHSNSRDGKSSEGQRPGLWGSASGKGSDDDPRGASSEQEAMANAISIGQQRPGQHVNASHKKTSGGWEADHAFDERFRSKWCPEPDVGRVANGVPARMDRLKALGNAVVPQVVEMIGNAILAAEGDTQ